MEDYNEYYIQGSDHYLIPKDELEELFNEMVNWKEESQKQQDVIDRTINAIDLVIELIKQQPTEDDRWILDRLNGFKIILEDKEVSDDELRTNYELRKSLELGSDSNE